MTRWLAGLGTRGWRCRRGATAIEYGLIAALICVAAMGAIRTLGKSTFGMWTNVAANVTDATR